MHQHSTKLNEMHRAEQLVTLASKILRILSTRISAFEQSPNVTWLKDKFNAELLQILREYSDVIRSMLFGHNHRDSFRLLKVIWTLAYISMFYR